MYEQAQDPPEQSQYRVVVAVWTLAGVGLGVGLTVGLGVGLGVGSTVGSGVGGVCGP